MSDIDLKMEQKLKEQKEQEMEDYFDMPIQ